MSDWNREYVGNGRAFKFSNGGSSINCSVADEDLDKFPRRKDKNGKLWVDFSVLEKREADQWGNTHAVQISKPSDYEDPRGESDGAAQQSSGNGWT